MRISDWSSDVCSSDLAGCRAALPAAEEGAVQRHRHGTIQVRVVQHHERILPPHLQLKTGGRGGRVNGQFAPDASGPGEGESLDTRITDQLGGHRTWYKDVIEHALRYARLDKHVAQSTGDGRGRSEEHKSELQSLMRK